MIRLIADEAAIEQNHRRGRYWWHQWLAVPTNTRPTR